MGPEREGSGREGMDSMDDREGVSSSEGFREESTPSAEAKGALALDSDRPWPRLGGGAGTGFFADSEGCWSCGVV